MVARNENESTPVKNPTKVERTSEREVVVTRTVNASAHTVFDAWTTPELFKQWWVPKSFGVALLSCELDVRVGGTYRLVFGHGGSEMAFFGKYLEVAAPSRLVWTNDEEVGGGTITTLTLEEKAGRTLLVLHDLYPSKEALDEAMESGQTTGMCETCDQLAELLGTLGQTDS